MTRPYKPETLRALANEAEQFENSHSLNGERRTADLLYRVKKALRFSAQAIETRRAETRRRLGAKHESAVGEADAPNSHRQTPEEPHK